MTEPFVMVPFQPQPFVRAWAEVLQREAAPALWHVQAHSDATTPWHWPTDTQATPTDALLVQRLRAACWGLLPGLHRLRLWAPELGPTLTHLNLHIGAGAGASAGVDNALPPPTPAPNAPAREARVVVIGAGLAGAACARALAERGYRVQVLDQGAAPAAGASGLPVGLVAPHASPDDALLSRLSRAGVRAMRDAMQRLLHEGQDWGHSGVQERRLPGKTRKGGMPAHWAQAHPEAAADWTCPHPDPRTPAHTLWHAHGAWVRPARLVQALLNHPGVAWQGHRPVRALRSHGGVWQIDARSATHHASPAVIEADHVILACGPAVPTLLQASGLTSAVPPMHALRGQVSWGLMRDVAGALADPRSDAPTDWPSSPVNGHGSFVHGVPSEDGPAWYAGATYDRTRHTAELLAHDHDENLERLRALLPALATHLAPAFARGQVRGWAGVRCTVPDRLPMVGRLPHTPEGLWVCSAMGSRGLTLAVLCGELLAAQWTGEPSPIEPPLAHALRAERFAQRAIAP